jgi:hypothetical protein
VVAAQDLVEPGKHRPDDVLVVGEHEGTSVGSVCWALTAVTAGRARSSSKQTPTAKARDGLAGQIALRELRQIPLRFTPRGNRSCRRIARFWTAHRQFGRDRGGGPQGGLLRVSNPARAGGPHWPVMWSDSVTSWYRRGADAAGKPRPPAYAADHGSDEEDRHSRR